MPPDERRSSGGQRARVAGNWARGEVFAALQNGGTLVAEAGGPCTFTIRFAVSVPPFFSFS